MSNDFRKFTKMLVDNGYKRVRIRGSHYTYQNETGNTITINKDPNKMVMRKLILQNNLVKK